MIQWTLPCGNVLNMFLFYHRVSWFVTNLRIFKNYTRVQFPARKGNPLCTPLFCLIGNRYFLLNKKSAQESPCSIFSNAVPTAHPKHLVIPIRWRGRSPFCSIHSIICHFACQGIPGVFYHPSTSRMNHVLIFSRNGAIVKISPLRRRIHWSHEENSFQYIPLLSFYFIN